MYYGFSTSTTDQHASVTHSRTRPTRKYNPRVTDGVEHPVTITRVEPIVPTDRSMSAVQAEMVDRFGYLPSLGS